MTQNGGSSRTGKIAHNKAMFKADNEDSISIRKEEIVVAYVPKVISNKMNQHPRTCKNNNANCLASVQWNALKFLFVATSKINALMIQCNAFSPTFLALQFMHEFQLSMFIFWFKENCKTNKIELCLLIQKISSYSFDVQTSNFEIDINVFLCMMYVCASGNIVVLLVASAKIQSIDWMQNPNHGSLWYFFLVTFQLCTQILIEFSISISISIEIDWSMYDSLPDQCTQSNRKAKKENSTAAQYRYLQCWPGFAE